MSHGPVLCGIDFSEDSRQALRVARGLATALKRELLIATVLDPLIAQAGAACEGDAFQEKTAADLGDFASATGVSREVRPVVAVGDPARQLEHLAAAHEASLIVVGTRGLGRAKRMFYGSTTLRLLRDGAHPVLAVPLDTDVSGPALFGHVVCGVDFSEASLVAARAAVELGATLGVPVTLVHAVAPVTVPTAWDALARGAAEDRLRDTTSHLAELAASLGSPAPATVAQIGGMDDVISSVASARPRALIVLGPGGAHAHRLLTQARSPVLFQVTTES